jgi:hypothetical protein
MVKSGGLAIVEWLVRLFNACMNMGNAPDDWISVILILLFKGKGDRRNSRTIEVYVYLTRLKNCMEVLIERISEIIEVQIRGEQVGFRKGKGCVYLVFGL